MNTEDIVIDENGFMLSTRFLPSWQRRAAIAAGCGALAVSAMTGIEPATAENHNKALTSSESISLYGETTQTNQMGQGYIIFEERGETLVGAFYYPQSEYSCFTGRKVDQTLEILALPSHQEPMTSFDLSLDQMHAISTIGSSERQTLSACRKDVIAFLNQQQTVMDQNNKQLANRLLPLLPEAANNN